jgi:hypothetical protein
MNARERLDVKKDDSVIVDTSAARISIEDGAQFDGRIKIDWTKSQTAGDCLSISFSKQGENNYRPAREARSE